MLLTGGDTRQIENELEKIDLYLGSERSVTTEEVRQLVPLSRAGVIFELGNALAACDLDRALALVRGLLDQGETAIGILLGIGFYFAATVGAGATLAILAVFRFIEHRLPAEFYAHHSLTFERTVVMAEDELRRLIGEHGFSIANLAYHLSDSGKFFEYSMVIKSRDRGNADALARHLSKLPEVLEFRIDPTGD